MHPYLIDVPLSYDLTPEQMRNATAVLMTILGPEARSMLASAIASRLSDLGDYDGGSLAETAHYLYVLGSDNRKVGKIAHGSALAFMDSIREVISR